MSLVVQPSLFGSSGDLGLTGLGESVERRHLSDGAWIDVRPGFVTSADELFDALAGTVPWREERMRMYDSTVRVPRLVARYAQGEALPHPLLEDARSALSAHYLAELGEPFVSAGLCLYRDGNDSVAWHGDRIARESQATRWWRSSRWVPPGRSRSVRRRAAPDCAFRSATATCW
jgi:alkylated DNA repair dioxygenase AlkB